MEERDRIAMWICIIFLAALLVALIWTIKYKDDSERNHREEQTLDCFDNYFEKSQGLFYDNEHLYGMQDMVDFSNARDNLIINLTACLHDGIIVTEN